MKTFKAMKAVQDKILKSVTGTVLDEIAGLQSFYGISTGVSKSDPELKVRIRIDENDSSFDESKYPSSYEGVNIVFVRCGMAVAY